MAPVNPPPENLPDPWLFDSEALLFLTNGDCNATHFGIQLTVNAIWTLRENLRFLLHLHREQQRAIRKQHQQSLSVALAQNAATTKKQVVHLHHELTPVPKRNGRRRPQVSEGTRASPKVA